MMDHRVFDIVENLIVDCKWIYKSTVKKIYLTLVNSYKLPDNQNTVNNMRDAIIDHFWGGVEPEYDDLDDFEFWEKMTPEKLKEM